MSGNDGTEISRWLCSDCLHDYESAVSDRSSVQEPWMLCRIPEDFGKIIAGTDRFFGKKGYFCRLNSMHETVIIRVSIPLREHPEEAPAKKIYIYGH